MACLVATACDFGLFGPDFRSTLTVRYSAAEALVDVSTLTVHLRSGGWERTVVGSTDSFGIPVDDLLDVDIVLTFGSDTVAMTHESFEVLPEHGFSIVVYAGQGDPRGFGWVVCTPSVISIPVLNRPDALQADTVYMTWFGLQHDAIC